MNPKLRAAAAAILLACLVAGNAGASTPTPPTKKHATSKKVSKPANVSIQNQIEQLRRDFESQASRIDQLNSALAAKDEQLKKVAQVAAESQAATAKAETVGQAQQQAASENAASVSALQSAVTVLKANQTSLATTVSDETAKIRKSIDNPVVLHYKGITLTPSGFVVGDFVDRTHATGGELATPWSAIPFEHADAYSMTEMFLSARQSRIALTAEGKTSWGTMRAIFEGDFMGAGTTSNDNQSTSYLFRQRIVLGEVETNSHWTVSGGQGWTLATENKTGITTAAANLALPMMIDPNYVAGLVWARMGNFRLTKSFSKASFAVSAENPQLLYTASLAGNTPYAVVGSAGLSGAAMNQAVSGCSPSNNIVNYTNLAVKDANGVTVNSPSAVFKLVNSCANMANISFNKAPDVVVKAAFDPKFGHFEVLGIGRLFHETVYPGETTNGNLYGGNKDIVTGLLVAPALNVIGSYSNNVLLGGVGGSMRVSVVPNKLFFGAKGLFGPGVGHFGSSTLPDATSNASGELAPIHNLSGLLTVEANASPRLSLYTYYGGDYAGRADYGSAATTTLAAPTAAQSAAGLWGGTWKAPTAAAVGYGSRLLTNSTCNTTTNPGINGGSTGYYSGGSCSAQTRDVQEVTGGYWYDFYKGDRGRLRQGVQYSYAVREAWSGAGGIGAKGIENMVFTSFRYYLP